MTDTRRSHVTLQFAILDIRTSMLEFCNFVRPGLEFSGGENSWLLECMANYEIES